MVSLLGSISCIAPSETSCVEQTEKGSEWITKPKALGLDPESFVHSERSELFG